MRLSSTLESSATRARVRTWAPAVACLLALAHFGCSVDDPDRISTNQRTARIEYDPTSAIVPTGTVTVEGSGLSIGVVIQMLPILADPSSGDGFAYEGWISYPDTGTARAYRSTGRFRVTNRGANAEYPNGDVRFTYERTGQLHVLSGGDELAEGEALPDTLDFSESSFFVAIEPDPDVDLGPGLTHLLISKTDLPAADDVELVVPVNEGLGTVGNLSTIEGEAVVNAATGEFRLVMRQMPFISRTAPPTDTGLIYQAWFVDDDNPHPHAHRYQSIARFNPNQVGDAVLTGAMNPGDGDGDNVPEPLDFERLVISIEPDMITVQQ
ncbi:MAG TPA: hypothetical protein VNM87_09285, partial [Candidatus Udaeobacter sp.]|nr:hypothetical protein [Candidatus Udaeobacter sp.]